MQGRTDAVAAPRSRTSRAASMSNRQRREAIVELIASWLERAIGERTCPTEDDIVIYRRFCR